MRVKITNSLVWRYAEGPDVFRLLHRIPRIQKHEETSSDGVASILKDSHRTKLKRVYFNTDLNTEEGQVDKV